MVPIMLIYSVVAALKGFAPIGRTESRNDGIKDKALAAHRRRGCEETYGKQISLKRRSYILPMPYSSRLRNFSCDGPMICISRCSV